jgi:hypothetical protein
MNVSLEYASETSSAYVKPERLVGVVATWVGVIAAGVIVGWSAHLASEAQMRLMVPTNCGTGRHEAEVKLCYSMPWFLIVPTTAWILSRASGVGALVCRCALWASIVGWETSVVFVLYRHEIRF